MKAAHRAVIELEAGYTWVNALQIAHDELPFGGTKESGFGQSTDWRRSTSTWSRSRSSTAWCRREANSSVKDCDGNSPENPRFHDST